MARQESVVPFRILYVEDNVSVREITCELLARDTREIVAVSNGEEGLNAFENGRFDLVITDVSLPVMSGLDLVRHVKRLNPSMPVIVASGYSLAMAEAQLGPRVRAIIKPFDGAQLDGLIQDLCNGGQV